jgi:hypothetical protein
MHRRYYSAIEQRRPRDEGDTLGEERGERIEDRQLEECFKCTIEAKQREVLKLQK